MSVGELVTFSTDCGAKSNGVAAWIGSPAGDGGHHDKNAEGDESECRPMGVPVSCVFNNSSARENYAHASLRMFLSGCNRLAHMVAQ